MVPRVHDANLATRLPVATLDGRALVEADRERLLSLRLPEAVEVTGPEEIDLVLDAARESRGPRATAAQALELFYHVFRTQNVEAGVI